MGNSVKPATNPYKTGVVYEHYPASFPGFRHLPGQVAELQQRSSERDGQLQAYRARTNASSPATVFVIGLGGQGADPTDHTLLRRVATDATATPASGTTSVLISPSCVTYPAQPQGPYIYSSDANVLKAKFLELSSQILRLSQ